MEKIIIKLPYIDRITVAQKIRSKYHHKYKYKPYNIEGKILGKRLTEGLANNTYSFDESDYIIDSSTRERIIANPKKAGEVREWVINFQAIYNGTIKKHVRNNYLNKLKELITPWIDIEPITEFPLRIEFFMYAEEMNVDVDNKGVIYHKVFADILKTLKVIPDDDGNYIRDTGRTVWIPTPKHREKMEFHISKIE